VQRRFCGCEERGVGFLQVLAPALQRAALAPLGAGAELTNADQLAPGGERSLQGRLRPALPRHGGALRPLGRGLCRGHGARPGVRAPARPPRLPGASATGSTSPASCACGGRITLRCESADGAACFSVLDSGMGVAPHKLEKIFEPFVQVRSESTREHGGTGLGLAISRSIA
jgi:hypothetical protein